MVVRGERQIRQSEGNRRENKLDENSFNRTFHRIAQLCGAMGNPLGPV